MKYLIATLYGVQCSWGSTARGNDIRPTDQLPTQSALIGLAGAAMGAREESELIHTLHHDLETGVKVENEGVRESEYQTTETIVGTEQNQVQNLIKTSLDRKTLMEKARKMGKVETKTSRRFYLADAVYTVAYRAKNGEVDLEELVERFNKPVFPLFLGRKQFLPASDLYPEIVEADSFEDALMQRNSFEILEQQMPEGESCWVSDIDRTKVMVAVPDKTGNDNEWSIVRNDFCFDPALRAFSGRKEYRSYIEL